jgi:hypothetical protein
LGLWDSRRVGLKNRDPANWRDAWQIEGVIGKYIISDKPMTEEEWIKERATVIDAEAEDAPQVEAEAALQIEDKTPARPGAAGREPWRCQPPRRAPDET